MEWTKLNVELILMNMSSSKRQELSSSSSLAGGVSQGLCKCQRRLQSIWM